MRKDLERKADWIALKAFSLGKSLFTGNSKSFFVQQKN
uniref:Ribosomal protein L32 n=2 Tax=Stapeliinae TaxID=1498475 RepID=A0A059XS43_9GENT|nr:ribosomal protein L32 [Caralluma crenulata]AIA24130.1 ribosomal protein L32 [Tridentea gemmiflora]